MYLIVFDSRLTSKGKALSGSSLIEHDDSVNLWVEVSSVGRWTPPPWASMKHNYRFALCISGLLIVYVVEFADLEEASLVRVAFWVQGTKSVDLVREKVAGWYYSHGNYFAVVFDLPFLFRNFLGNFFLKKSSTHLD